jgi:hypothetical protein
MKFFKKLINPYRQSLTLALFLYIDRQIIIGEYIADAYVVNCFGEH